jgi:hypothetical protein
MISGSTVRFRGAMAVLESGVTVKPLLRIGAI